MALESHVHRHEFGHPGGPAHAHIECAAVEVVVSLNGRETGRRVGAWTPLVIDLGTEFQDRNVLEIRTRYVDHPTNGFLPDIGMRWCGVQGVSISQEPAAATPAAAPRAAVRGEQLLVDGQPFRMRGILHWGYYPELGHPWPSEEQMRREIVDLQALGFNLIKFCLWIPPRRYYELCEELGMLVWQEYPLWNQPLHGDALLEEYEVFLRHDRPYSCIILRSLTCENDHVDPELAAGILERARQLVPGAVLLDNSAWLCSERSGDVHDEHIYLHNLQWPFYARRMEGRLRKPLLLGESFAVDSIDRASCRTALEIRRFQIGTFTRDFPHGGYVVTALRDLETCPLGLFTATGQPKYQPSEWAWHGREVGPHREIPALSGPVIGPRKGQWKNSEHTFWSPVMHIHAPDLPRELIERELFFDLFSGRHLTHTEGCKVLVEVQDVHDGSGRALPLVIEFESEGEYRLVSALREDTAAGRDFRRTLEARRGPAPEIGPVRGDSVVLEQWTMILENGIHTSVRCDTPLVNRGRNVFEGWAVFQADVEYPGGPMTLRCEAVGDYYSVHIDGQFLGEAGNQTGTWDGTRDVPRAFSVDLEEGTHRIELQVRDWRGAGGLVGPVYLTKDLSLRIF